MPGKDGGRGKLRIVEWSKRATHMCEDATGVPSPRTTLYFSGFWDDSSEANIYKLDQELARAQIAYFASPSPPAKWHRGFSFDVIVFAGRAADARHIIESIQKPAVPPVTRGPVTGFCREIDAKGLSKNAARELTWRFAVYHEWSSERDDGRTYEALIMHDSERNLWGMKEWLDPDIPHFCIVQKLVDRIARERDAYKEFLSDDLDIPKMWRRL